MAINNLNFKIKETETKRILFGKQILLNTTAKWISVLNSDFFVDERVCILL